MSNGQRRTRRTRWWIVAPGLLLILLVAYVFGYFAFSHGLLGNRGVRIFHVRWMAYYYGPAATVESLLSGSPKQAVYMPPEHCGCSSR